MAALCMSATAFGQASAEATEVANLHFTESEQAALAAYNENHPVTARRLAGDILDVRPDSLVAHYVLGCVMREVEGALPNAMFHLGTARELYESRWSVAPRSPGAPWQLHRELLWSIQTLAGELEQFEYQIQILDFHDALYHPDMLAEHAWPLMHLGRFDEARDYAQRAVASSEAWQRSLGYNALCAIEGEAGQREACFDACLAAFENAIEESAREGTERIGTQRFDAETGAALQQNIAVHAYNAALAAFAVLRPEEVERLALEGISRIEFTPANPWRLLVRLYLDQGRMRDAANALREMMAWRRRQPANLRDMDRAETDTVSAMAFLVSGHTERGLELISRAIEYPDRRGLTTSTAEQALGAHALLRRALVRAHAEIIAERESWGEDVDEGLVEAFNRQLDYWPDRQRIISVLADEDRLVSTLRLYIQGGIEPVPVWLLGDLVEVLGPGVMAVALRRAQALETMPELDPYYDALAAEIALSRGDEDEALALALRALETLPETEALLRARVAALGAQAALEEDHFTRAVSLLENVLQADPSTIRRSGLSLPVSIQNNAGGPGASDVESLLRDSPRLDVQDRGFVVLIAGQSPLLSACLHSAQGTVINCVQLEAPEPAENNPAADSTDVDLARVIHDNSAEGIAQRLAEAFHREIFAVPLGLTSTDLNSLDGSTTVAEDAVRQQMRDAFERMVGSGD